MSDRLMVRVGVRRCEECGRRRLHRWLRLHLWSCMVCGHRLYTEEGS